MRKSHPSPERRELEHVIQLVAAEASAYLGSLDERPARSKDVRRALDGFKIPLPEEGEGAVQALRELIDRGLEASVATSGPRCFHFVIGGTTPAALGADWLASTLDQMVYAWVASPLATELELISLDWLKELFGIPLPWQGIMTTGATMANFVCLASARQWLGERQGVDVAEDGLTSLSDLKIYASGIIHPSDIKALSMLGMGRSSVQVIANENRTFNTQRLEASLGALQGSPALIMAVAGEPNAGKFDPISELADLAGKHNAWLHVDGAFGLFAALSPEHAGLVAGIERAHSVTVDGHKWLNVPYDCGFAFVGEPALVGKSFAHSAEYLPDPTDPEPVLGSLGPEMSRRARSLAVWATLRAYGRKGIRSMVERNIYLARYLAELVEDAPDLELLAEVPLNVVCYRFNPGGLSEEKLNRINSRLGAAILDDGRVFVGTTNYANMIALRPAIVNWRTRESDIELLVEISRQLGHQAANGL